MVERKKVILDVDAGVDDALAIILARHSPELEVVAITTVGGNVCVDHCTKNVLRVLALLGADSYPIIARGAAQPFGKDFHSAASVHGPDGLGDLGDDYYPPLDWKLVSAKPAAELIPELAEQNPGELTLIATGPLTNLAQAMEKSPTGMSQLGEIIAMAGAIKTPGNIPPLGAAEFNAYADPDALQRVLEFCVPVTLVPLDVTHQVPLLRSRVQEELGSNAERIPRFILEASQRYMDFYHEDQGHDGCYLHDPLAVGVAIDSSFVRTEPVRIYVETKEGMTRGMTVPFLHPRKVQEPANCRVAVAVEVARFLRVFFQRISAQ